MNNKKFKELIIVNNQSYKDKRGYFKEVLIEKKNKKKISISSNVVL